MRLLFVLFCLGLGSQAQAQSANVTPPLVVVDPKVADGPEPPPAGYQALPGPDDPEPPPAGETPAGADPVSSAEHLRRSVEAFQSKDFLRAATELQAAYRQDPKPLLLFNIGQAYRRAGRAQEALDAYEQFMRADPKSPLRPETEGYCNDMRTLLEEQKRKAQVESALASEKQAAVEKEKALRTEKERTALAQQKLQQERKRAEDELSRQKARRRLIIGLSVGAISLAVLGGAAVAVGVALRPKDPTTDGGFVNVSFALSR
ncbi:MAG: tetratricopeptide repeat protein [Myxococcales bacterium]|nr:tetratricopeptide repeat protein [Myxococcales bacterium]